MGNWIPGDPTLVAQILRISSSYSPPPPEGFVSPMTGGSRTTWSNASSLLEFPKAGFRASATRSSSKPPVPPSELLASFRNYYGPTMNAFEAAEASGRARELLRELEVLFNEQNQSPTKASDRDPRDLPARDRRAVNGRRSDWTAKVPGSLEPGQARRRDPAARGEEQRRGRRARRLEGAVAEAPERRAAEEARRGDRRPRRERDDERRGDRPAAGARARAGPARRGPRPARARPWRGSAPRRRPRGRALRGARPSPPSSGAATSSGAIAASARSAPRPRSGSASERPGTTPAAAAESPRKSGATAATPAKRSPRTASASAPPGGASAAEVDGGEEAEQHHGARGPRRAAGAQRDRERRGAAEEEQGQEEAPLPPQRDEAELVGVETGRRRAAHGGSSNIGAAGGWRLDAARRRRFPARPASPGGAPRMAQIRPLTGDRTPGAAARRAAAQAFGASAIVRP